MNEYERHIKQLAQSHKECDRLKLVTNCCYKHATNFTYFNVKGSVQSVQYVLEVMTFGLLVGTTE